MLQDQMHCKTIAEKYLLANHPEVRLLDTISELGELSKALLKSSNYGNTPFMVTEEIAMEMGDCLFSLLCLCNSLHIDAHDALINACKKYDARFAAHGAISSGR